MAFTAEYLLPFLIVLTILVFVHELGHFLVARWCGVHVDVFSIGFGPELLGYTDRRGTRWKFSLIPLGGYVKMLGDADESSRPGDMDAVPAHRRHETLHHKSVGQRMAVTAAGPAANYIFAVVALAVLLLAKGMPYYAPVVGSVKLGMPADIAGMQVGDRVLEFNGAPVTDFVQMRQLIQQVKPDAQVHMLVERAGVQKALIYTPKKSDVPQKGFQLGIAPSGVEFKALGPVQALVQAFTKTVELSWDMLRGIAGIARGQQGADQLGGILTIGDMAAKSVQQGMGTLLFFMAVLSINLGLINLFPVPMLDGGHLLMYSIEAVRGKPLSQRVQEIMFTTGFVLVMGLMVFALWNDFKRYAIVQKIMALIGM